jgi:hypothetical protein
LKLKEFSVSTAPEVGRIIETQNLPSSPNFAFLSIRCNTPDKTPLAKLFYIEIEEIFKARPLP